jgi:hypothetical protein
MPSAGPRLRRCRCVIQPTTVHLPTMIILMTTSRRPQQRYDHRLRELVRGIEEVTSTARGWLREAPKVVVTLDITNRGHPGEASTPSACSIRVSIAVFQRIWRIVRRPKCVKVFDCNTRQWCESHALRQPVSFSLSKCCHETSHNCAALIVITISWSRRDTPARERRRARDRGRRCRRRRTPRLPSSREPCRRTRRP